MEKPTYYSKKYTQQMAPITREQIEKARPAMAVKTAHRSRKVVPMLLVFCLAIAFLAVLIVPLLLGGAAPVNAATGSNLEVTAVAYDSAQQAVAAAGVQAAGQPELPEGYVAGQYRVLDGSVLEMDIAGAKNVISFRVAKGNLDLTTDLGDAFAFSTTETSGDITRGYTGVSEKKLNTAVWVDGGFCYALVSADGVDAAVMRLLADCVA